MELVVTNHAMSRFWSHVDRSTGPDGCWTWTGYREKGYGRFFLDQAHRSVRAHRLAYEQGRGPIPDGLQLDHLCRNRACVNPAHLEPVTQRTNILRGASPSALNAQKTHCPNGHSYSEDNVRVTQDGYRECRTCRRDWSLTRYHQTKGRAN